MSATPPVLTSLPLPCRPWKASGYAGGARGGREGIENYLFLSSCETNIIVGMIILTKVVCQASFGLIIYNTDTG
jgi:hypothetical protein